MRYKSQIVLGHGYIFEGEVDYPDDAPPMNGDKFTYVPEGSRVKIRCELNRKYSNKRGPTTFKVIMHAVHMSDQKERALLAAGWKNITEERAQRDGDSHDDGEYAATI